jgi:hypothetical protein
MVWSSGMRVTENMQNKKRIASKEGIFQFARQQKIAKNSLCPKLVSVGAHNVDF